MVLHGIQCDKCDNFSSSFPVREPPSSCECEAKLARTCDSTQATSSQTLRLNSVSAVDLVPHSSLRVNSRLFADQFFGCIKENSVRELTRMNAKGRHCEHTVAKVEGRDRAGLTKYQKKKLERRDANDDP